MTEQKIRLTFKGGGWVLVMTAIVISGFIAWAIAPAIFRLSEHVIGDGSTIESYDFDLSNLQLQSETIIPVMQHRNMSPVMTHPEIFTLEQIEARNAVQRDPYLISDDLVVGITIAGHSRAYPLHVLHVHEIINDVLGDIPIAVTWHWPSGHVAVYRRTVQGEELQFANSGLGGNGGLLMYNLREEVGGEQLFSSLLGSSISGTPIQLQAVPHDVRSWSTWNATHRDTTVIAAKEYYKKRYRKGDPKMYFLTDTIYYPSSPMPEDGTNPKTLIIAIPTSSGHAVFSIPALLTVANDEGQVDVTIENKVITFSVTKSPLSAIVRDSSGNIVPSQRALWFAWYGNHPQDVITTP